MTETCTQTKQLHLVNIITFAEDKLQTNFSRILNRLNNQEKNIENNEKNIIKLTEIVKNLSENIQKKLYEQCQNNEKIVSQVRTDIESMEKSFQSISEKSKEQDEEIKKLQKVQDYLREFIDSDCKSRATQSQKIRQKLRNIQYEINSIGGNLVKKQNVSQVLKLKQSIAQFSQQITKLQSEQKFVQFKVDKFQISNQKMQKNQMNKQMMLMKDLQQKIKRQLKGNMSSMSSSQNNQQNHGTAANTHVPQLGTNLTTNSTQPCKMVNLQVQNLKDNFIFNKCSSSSELLASEKPSSQNANQQRFSSFQNQVISYAQNKENQLNQKILKQINETINFHDRRFDVLERQIKGVMQWWETSQKPKKNSHHQFQERLNAIKPQFIRIWAKFDALEEKAGVIDRKMQEKNHQISIIMDILKQTQAAKFDQKLKSLQAEMLVNIKDIRSKLQGKVNCVDFQKFCKTTLEKIQNLYDQVILKSDKTEVKKALLFLQSKIKEIILVISEQEENQKDALLTKKQLKCISCDKDVEKNLGTVNGLKGNWDAFPFKQHSNDSLGRFGMTSYGTLARKLKKLDKEIPSFPHKRNKQSTHSQSKVDFH